LIATLSSAAPSPALAGKPEPLDTDFLDYLAACEGKDDNWTVIAGDKQRRKVADKEPPRATAPQDESARKPEKQP
jgi:hypothetical protein